MAGLSGTGAGLSSEPGPPSDLELIYQGGKNFLDRMKAMAAQKDAHDDALAQLNLGNDIIATQKAAQAALDAAKAKQEEANKVLADAKSQASTIVAGAHSLAKQTTDAANSSANQAKTDAAKVRRDADAYAADAKDKADAALAEAKQKLSEVAAKTLAADQAKADAVAAMEAAKAAKKDADAAKAAHDDRVAKLNAIISQPVTAT